MSTRFDPLGRWRRLGRSAVHGGLAALRDQAPPTLARQIAGLDRWLCEQERRADHNRERVQERVQEAWYGVRRRLAAGVRRLENAVRPT